MHIALPSIGRDLHASTSTLSWVINAYVPAFGGLLLLGGRLADLIGRRRLLTAGLALFGLAPSPADCRARRRPPHGLASGLINTSQQVGGALGLAVVALIADARTRGIAAADATATNDGYRISRGVAHGLTQCASVSSR